MLKPSMQELMKRVGNRYLLVNLAAQRARDIADQADETETPLPDKAVKLALDEIAAGTIVYRPGPRTTTVIPQNNAIASAIIDVDDSIDLDEDEVTLDEDDTERDEDEEQARSLTEFSDNSLGDGDIPEEDQ